MLLEKVENHIKSLSSNSNYDKVNISLFNEEVKSFGFSKQVRHNVFRQSQW